jgi:hypothetical protein
MKRKALHLSASCPASSSASLSIALLSQLDHATSNARAGYAVEREFLLLRYTFRIGLHRFGFAPKRGASSPETPPSA